MKNKTVSAKELKRISAYLDGELSRSQAQDLEAQFRENALLKQTYLELKQTRILLNHAKTLPVPRNFTLTPEMAAQIKPVKKPFVIPALSISSALAILVMVFAIAFEIFPSSNLAQFAQSQATEKMMADEAAPMAESLTIEQPFADDTNTRGMQDLQGNPPIINWGASPGSGGGGGGDGFATGLGGGPIGGGVEEEPAISAMDTPNEVPPGEEVPVEENTGTDIPAADAPPPDLAAPDLPLPTNATPTPDAQSAAGAGGEEPQSPVEEEIQPTREAELFAQPTSEPITGTGPILGIRSAEEAEIYNDTVLEILDNEEMAYQRAQNQIPLIRLVQITAAAIALITGFAAFWINRKTRY